MANRRTPHGNLFGILGANPKTRLFPGRIVSHRFLHAILEFVILREFTAKDRDFGTALLAIDVNEENGDKPLTVRVRLDDYRKLLAPYRRGDRIRIDGYFRFSGHDGDLRLATEFVVFAAELQTGKIRQRRV